MTPPTIATEPRNAMPRPVVFRGQYRPKGSRGDWLTVCERASLGAAWDEILTMPTLAGCDLRVERIGPPDRLGSVGLAPETEPAGRRPELFR